MQWVLSEGPVPMDRLSSQFDGKTEVPGSSLKGKEMNTACFNILFSARVEYA